MVAWLGFRLDLEPPFEPLLTNCLGRWLTDKRNEGLLKRWFFLRHSEQGSHLRLRMQPISALASDRLVAALERLERSAAPPFRLQPHVYERTIRAFGETRESVLAELLHVETSKLSLQLLSRLGERHFHARRWLLSATLSALVLRRAVPAAHLLETTTAWRSFAVRAAADIGVSLAPFDLARPDIRIAAVRTAAPQLVAALDLEEAARPTALLFRHAWERAAPGRFVAIHALHLFCNEMGLSIAAEYEMTAVLCLLLQERGEYRANRGVTAHA
jgi:thiopeptide-type bacteriocin biosynthesis protein